MASLLDSKLVKPETMTDAQWLEIQEGLRDRKDELQKELSDDCHDEIMFDENKDLLKTLLDKHRHEGDESGGS